ncbi:hypothetical protein LCGC14_0195910 [marine sediment metagenome]|uniref:Uncharacterized protein n=1 Tax=marine sediment metagenome TaxID=412755 RepID=A0A0F9XNH4_9ZZZZ
MAENVAVFINMSYKLTDAELEKLYQEIKTYAKTQSINVKIRLKIGRRLGFGAQGTKQNMKIFVSSLNAEHGQKIESISNDPKAFLINK